VLIRLGWVVIWGVLAALTCNYLCCLWWYLLCYVVWSCGDISVFVVACGWFMLVVWCVCVHCWLLLVLLLELLDCGFVCWRCLFVCVIRYVLAFVCWLYVVWILVG